MKDKEKLNNCLRLEESKELRQLNVIWDPELDPRREIHISGKTEGI